MKTFSILLLQLVITTCSINHKHYNSDWTIAYKNDKQGGTLIGSKKQLIDTIRQGASIKIGWGSKGENHSIEHLAEPIWIAVIDEKEVIAHLPPQVLSKTNWDTLSANYQEANLTQFEWRVVLTSKGEFDAIWIDKNTRIVSKRIPQHHTITWFVKDIDLSKPTKQLFNNK